MNRGRRLVAAQHEWDGRTDLVATSVSEWTFRPALGSNFISTSDDFRADRRCRGSASDWWLRAPASGSAQYRMLPLAGRSQLLSSSHGPLNGVQLCTRLVNSCLSLRRRLADCGSPPRTLDGSPRRFAPRDDNRTRGHRIDHLTP